MKKTITTWPALAVIILALCMIPQAALAAEHGQMPGHRHVETEIYYVPGSGGMQIQGTHDARYNSAEQNWYTNSNIQVKDQGNSNTCWACSASSAAEISYSKETKTKVDPISPPQIAYFYFNRLNDPLGNTSGDKNLAIKDWNKDGGSCVNTFQHLATWSGMIEDSKAPLSDLRAYYGNDPNKPAPTNYLDDSRAYQNNYLTLENCEFHSSLDNNETGRDQLKTMIETYGAVVVSMNCNSRYFKDGNLGNANYYFCDPYSPRDEGNTHEVILVGWDDNYLSTNFGSRSRNGDGYIYQPTQNGAWIMQNSWGNGTAEDPSGDNGYYYISYDSDDVMSDGILGLDMMSADTSLDYFQYDGNASSNTVEMLKNEKAANVFTAPKTHQIMIQKIGFTEYNEGATNYDVDIYRDLKDPGNPVSGTKVMQTKAVTTTTPGYKTFDLPSTVTVDAGMTFSIVITYKGTTLAGSEAAGRVYTAALASGNSFYYADGKWTDAASNEFCFRIKAIAEPFDCVHSYETVVVPPTKGVDGYTLDECTICGHQVKYDIKPMLKPVPNPTRLTSVKKSGKKKMVVRWNKQTEVIAGKHIDGYKIRYSLKKNMKKAKTVTVKNYNTTSKTIKKLKSGKRYYVQVQVFKTTNGQTYYSAWSNKKSVKIK